ncbi:MAG: GGDEF domain-containing protein, partial [Rickettsiales bacterium]
DGTGDRPDSRDTAAADEAVDIAAFHGLNQDDLTEKARIAMMELITEIGELRQELARNRKRIAYLSNLADHDDLSTALNRRAFLRELSHAQVLARDYGAVNALLFVTVENLKEINEGYGHQAGDEMIEHVAAVMLRHLGKADVVGRLGGAEFAVVLVGHDTGRAHDTADGLKKYIEGQPLMDGGIEVPAVVGVSVHGLDPDEDAEDALMARERDEAGEDSPPQQA